MAGDVEDMVHAPNLMPLFFYIFTFLFHVLCINQLLETKTTCSASYGKEKSQIPTFIHRCQGKSHQPKSLWDETNRTPATPNKKANSD